MKKEIVFLFVLAIAILAPIGLDYIPVGNSITRKQIELRVAKMGNDGYRPASMKELLAFSEVQRPASIDELLALSKIQPKSQQNFPTVKWGLLWYRK